MAQKTAFIFSAILTAFLLVVGGGLIARVSQPGEAAAQASAAPAAPGVDQTAQIQAIIQEREAAYRQLIQQANERLKQAYQQQAQAALSPQSAVASSSSAAAAYAVSPEMAASIAANAASGAALTRQAELVLFEGKAAYEVLFDRGAVYVDANSGQVLYNGVSAPAAPAAPAPAVGGEHEDNHESAEHAPQTGGGQPEDRSTQGGEHEGGD